MAKRLSRVDREIRDHPERFDFGDCPPMRSGPAWEAYTREMDTRQPAWVKAMLAERRRKD